MPVKIHDWGHIAQHYRGGSLLLGNGASISIDARFGYSKIIDHARGHRFLPHDIEQLFAFFKTEDFELVLRLVWQASNVNRSLQIHDEKTHAAYLRVRQCLIQSVRSIHPEHQEISEHLQVIYSFIKNFGIVISLNYDLILYWAIMYGNNVNDDHQLKDCFLNNKFYGDWERLREPIRSYRATTLAFYPHGSLILARDNVESESKVTSNGTSLLEAILEAWESEKIVPLFVSEGTSEQKINSIQNSSYLNTVYREVLTKLGASLVIYGWDLGDQDFHILKRIALSSVQNVAVSVYKNDQSYCNRVDTLIKQNLGNNVQVDFFHSDSPNCWNNAA
ncbi:DUF4917 family protein [Neisseriaceae bacterium TC5R-5]|nr:DUF4917 family protein [Neisseriaceae bacterium TC5R-5]